MDVVSARSSPQPGKGGAFVGRTHELAALSDCAHAAMQGQPELAVVEGEAGMGKTWLVHRFLADFPQFTVCWGECDPSEQDWSYGLIGQWIRRVPAALRDRAMIVEQRLSPSASAVQVGLDLMNLLGMMEAEEPVALIADDVQWIDEPSMKALLFLLRRVHNSRLLVVLLSRTPPPAHRPASESPGWKILVKDADCQVVRLSGLNQDDVAALVAAAGAKAAGSLVASRLLQHTSGHPLYLHSLLASTSVEQIANAGHDLPVPMSLAEAVHALVDRLPPTSQGIVQALAVLNTPVPPCTAAALAEVDDAEAALEPAHDCGLIEYAPDTRGCIRIRHALQRDAIYQNIGPQLRQRLHSRAIDLVDPDLRWLHRVAASTQADARLAAELQAEATRQLTTDQTVRAASLLLWAADLSPTRREYERRLLLAAARMHSLPYLAGSRRFAILEDVEQCRCSPLRSCVLGRAAVSRGDLTAAEAHYREAITLAEELGDWRTHQRVQVWLGTLLIWRAEPDRALPIYRAVLAQGTLDPPAQVEARWGELLATGLRYGPHRALQIADEMANLPDDPRQVPPSDQVVLAVRAMLRQGAGDLVGARADSLWILAPEHAEAGLASLSARRTLALCAYQLGQWNEALQYIDQSIAQARLEGLIVGFPQGYASAAMVAAAQGRHAQAEAHLRTCRQWCDRLRGTMYEDIAPVVAATLAQTQDGPVAMVQHLDQLHDGPPTGWRLLNQNLELPLRAEAYIRTGRLAQGAQYVDHLLALSRHYPSLSLVASWASGLLAKARGDSRVALNAFKQAVDQPPSPHEMPIYRARIEHELGKLLLPDSPQQAAPWLARAYRHLRTLGATPEAERVRVDLSRTGLHPGTGPLPLSRHGRGTSQDTLPPELLAIDLDVLDVWSTRNELDRLFRLSQCKG